MLSYCNTLHRTRMDCVAKQMQPVGSTLLLMVMMPLGDSSQHSCFLSLEGEVRGNRKADGGALYMVCVRLAAAYKQDTVSPTQCQCRSSGSQLWL